MYVERVDWAAPVDERVKGPTEEWFCRFNRREVRWEVGWEIKMLPFTGDGAQLKKAANHILGFRVMHQRFNEGKAKELLRGLSLKPGVWGSEGFAAEMKRLKLDVLCGKGRAEVEEFVGIPEAEVGEAGLGEAEVGEAGLGEAEVGEAGSSGEGLDDAEMELGEVGEADTGGGDMEASDKDMNSWEYFQGVHIYKIDENLFRGCQTRIEQGV